MESDAEKTYSDTISESQITKNAQNEILEIETLNQDED